MATNSSIYVLLSAHMRSSPPLVCTQHFDWCTFWPVRFGSARVVGMVWSSSLWCHNCLDCRTRSHRNRHGQSSAHDGLAFGPLCSATGVSRPEPRPLFLFEGGFFLQVPIEPQVKNLSAFPTPEPPFSPKHANSQHKYQIILERLTLCWLLSNILPQKFLMY